MDEDRLQAARKVISEVDRDMARLFMKRMEAVRDIAAYKREKGLPILDAAQERVVIERNLSYIDIDDDGLRELYIQFLRQVMEVSKAYQRRLITKEADEA